MNGALNMTGGFLIATICACAWQDDRALGDESQPASALSPSSTALTATENARTTKIGRFESDADAVQDILFCDPHRPLLIRLHIFVDWEGFRVLRRRWADAQFDVYDSNKNGLIDGEERDRLPSREGFTKLASNDSKSLPNTDSEPTDGRVTPEVFRHYFLGSVGPSFSIESGFNFRNDQVELFPMLDQNRDGKLSQLELESSADRLRRYDRNEDDILEIPELLQPLPEDQAAARQQLVGSLAQLVIADPFQTESPIARRLLESYDKSTRDPVARTFRKDEKLSLAEINLDPQDFARADRDGNGKLDRMELGRITEAMTPTIELEIRTQAAVAPNAISSAVEQVGRFFSGEPSATVDVLSVKSIRPVQSTDSALVNIEQAGNGQHQLKLGDISFGLSTTSSPASDADQIRNTYLQQFKFLDGDKNDYLDSAEARRFGDSPFFTQADSDHDGKIFEREYIAQVDRELGLSKSAVSMTISSDGRSLFRLLDTDNDNRLSVREIRIAAEQFQKWDTNGDGSISLAELAVKLQAVFAAGVPKIRGPFGIPSPVETAGVMSSQTRSSSGNKPPPWFTKMDRNRDGDLSPREFLGKRVLFDQFDTNHDGLISPSEAKELPAADAIFPANVTKR